MALKGAIIGDIVGSAFEFDNQIAKNKQTPSQISIKWTKNGVLCSKSDDKTPILSTQKFGFTDDTVLSLAVKRAIKHERPFVECLDLFGNQYRDRGFGGMFLTWLNGADKAPYNSYGNGSAMRVSYIADHFDDFAMVQDKARESAECTHNHPEGVKGAIVTASCIWFAKHKIADKDGILRYAIACYPADKYPYSPAIPLDEMRKYYRWDVTCQGSVPAAIRCVYEANSYTEFVKNVLSLPCDTDTLCAIGGGIAEELFDNSNDELLSHADEILQMYLDDYLLKELYE